MATFRNLTLGQADRLDDLAFQRSGGRATFSVPLRRYRTGPVAVGHVGRLVGWGGERRQVVGLPVVVECVDPHPGDAGRVCVVVLVQPARDAGPPGKSRSAGEPGPPLAAGE
jgi:hypothetical protein